MSRSDIYAIFAGVSCVLALLSLCFGAIPFQSGKALTWFFAACVLVLIPLLIKLGSWSKREDLLQEALDSSDLPRNGKDRERIAKLQPAADKVLARLNKDLFEAQEEARVAEKRLAFCGDGYRNDAGWAEICVDVKRQELQELTRVLSAFGFDVKGSARSEEIQAAAIGQPQA